jgi:hypothetical protein
MLVSVVMVMMDLIMTTKFDVNKKIGKLRKKKIWFILEVEAEILDSNIDEAQLQRLRNGERPGALWHLFRSDDAKKIREYIGRVCHHISFRMEYIIFRFRLNVKLLVLILSMIKQRI